MNVTPVKLRDLPFKRQYHTIGKNNKEVKTPAFKCYDCQHCDGTKCDFYNRPVDTRLNRCFNHSNYVIPTQTTFKVTDNLEEIIKEEQEKLSA